MGGTHGSENVEINEDFIQQVFNDLDYNDDQHLYFSDFLTAVVCRKMKVEKDNDGLLKATFDRFDVDHSGMISVDNLKNLFGNEFRNVPVETLIKEADQDGNEMLDFEEFKTFIKRQERSTFKGLQSQSDLNMEDCGDSEALRMEMEALGVDRDLRPSAK
jgi:Ca2+-binding EF-hand superfamily protein